jgi:hypothetical protein
MGIYYPQETTLAPLAETTDAGELENTKLEERQRHASGKKRSYYSREIPRNQSWRLVAEKLD